MILKIYIMKTIRIIPRLDIKGPNLVKGIHSFRTLSEFYKVENKSWWNQYGDVSFYKVK